MNRFLQLSLIFSSVVWVPFLWAENPTALAEAATEQLKAEQSSVVFYAEGMGCQACVMGVRDELEKLTFVDTARLDTGIKFDVESKLVTVAIAAGQKVDSKAMVTAIDEAGYEPKWLYVLVDGVLKTSDLTQIEVP